MTKRKRLIVMASCAGVILVVLLVWFIAFLTNKSTIGQQPGQSASTEKTRVDAVLLQTDIQRLEASLVSSDAAKQGEALAPDLRAEYTSAGQTALPPGTKVTINATTFKGSGNFGEVEADVSGHGKTLLSLVKVENAWYILSTQKK